MHFTYRRASEIRRVPFQTTPIKGISKKLVAPIFLVARCIEKLYLQYTAVYEVYSSILSKNMHTLI